VSDAPALGGTGLTVTPTSVSTSPSIVAEKLLITSGGTGFPENQVNPEPIRTLQLPYERARMLATLPRKKWGEESWAALTGALGASPGALDAIHKACQRPAFSLEGYEIVEVLALFGFAVWLIVAIINSIREKTASEYLAELYPQPVKTNATHQK
jgi:hypothetical protein